jgi:hypothetical protein
MHPGPDICRGRVARHGRRRAARPEGPGDSRRREGREVMASRSATVSSGWDCGRWIRRRPIATQRNPK